MKNYNILAFALLGGSILLAASCVKEADLNEQYRPEGTPIVFTAATGYENGDATRTEYSGQFFAGSGNGLNGSTNAWERIDWVSGDPVTVYYKHPDNSYSNSKYAVAGNPVANAEMSDASVQVVSGSTALAWAGGNGNHVFTAVYPTRGFDGNSHSVFDGVEVRGFIPSTQTLHQANGKYLPEMKYATMVAYKSIPSSSTEQTVVLPFKPAFTAFEFRFRKQAGAVAAKVMSFTISSTTDDLAGPFSFNITGGDSKGAVWGTVGNLGTGSRSKSVTVSFGSGVTLSESADLDFTLLALPTNLTNITLTISYEGGSTKTIALKQAGTNTPVTFTACKKYIISNYVAGASSWEYVIEEVDDIVTYGHAAASLSVGGIRSYRRSLENANTIEAVPWKAQYWNGSAWQDWNAATGGFSLNSYAQGSGVSSLSSSESRVVNLTVNSTYQAATQTPTDVLRAATPVSNYDLSAHDIHGNVYPGNTHTTANTYVVSAPGTYLIPCVYGNAITNDQTNWEAFAPAGSHSSIKDIYSTYVATNYAQNGAVPLYRWPDVNYVPYFRNAINTNITNPYIYDDINSSSGFNITGENAVVVWQDAQIVSEQPSVTTIDGHKYIRFTIGANEIQPGNVVIALRGNPGGSFTNSKAILWSWQIWVTDQDLHPIGISMPANLGWTKADFGAQKYTDRSLPIRLVQILPGDDPNGRVANEEFTVTQFGDSRNKGENIGSSPYYQWGRKDPMIPGIYSTTTTNFVGQPCTDKPIYPTSDYTGMTFYTEDVTISTNNVDANYGTAIRHPNIAYAGLNTTTSWISGYFPGWTYLSDGQGGNGAGFAGRRSETAIPYNLWDAYCYGQGSDPDGTHKIKTVYDPCPPGFAVPYKNFANNLGSRSVASDNSGVYYTASNGASQFFPYSGARIFYNLNPNNTSVSVTPGLYINELASSGLYWTDCPLNIVTGSSYNASNNWASWSAYQKYQFAYIISMASTNSTLEYTRGTAGTIRPIVYVDPNYE